MSYRRKVVDLSALFDDKNLVEEGTRITEFFIPKMPTGALIAVKFGVQSDAIDLDAPISFEPDHEHGSHGLYVSNLAALPGVSAILYVVTGESNRLAERRDAR